MRKLQRVLATGVLAACCTFAAAGTWAADAPLSDAAVSARAKALVAKMTPEEKAGQLTQFFYFGEALGPLGNDPRLRKQLEDGVAAGNVGSLALVYEPTLPAATQIGRAHV